ncbi:MAG: pyruvate-formate lyase-activating enzyme, partial [Myxococcota bacterium]
MSEPGIGLVLCPCFGFGTPPLGLASLQTVLKAAGHRTIPFDLDFMLLAEQPETISALFRAYFIGHAEGIDRVQFILRPTLTLMALFPDAWTPEQKVPLAEDLQVIAQVDTFLQRWAQELIAHDVRIVMASVYVSNLLPTLLLARALHYLDPSIQLVLGGPGVAAPEIQAFVLALGIIDVCGTGEGERLAPALAERLLAGELPHVPGAAYLHEGTIVRVPVGPLVALSGLEAPDFSGLPVPGTHVRHYRANPNVSTRWFGVALPIATTRGCVMRCTFCSETNYWTRFRQRDPADVVDEIEALQEQWGVSQFTFGDSLLNGSPRWLEAFAELCVERQLSVTFVFAYFRPTRLPRPLLEKLWAAGFRLLAFGLETASQPLLDAMAKGTKAEEARQVVLDALDVGIHVNLSILCGVPGEGTEEVLDSIRFIESLRAEVVARSGEQAAAGLTVHAGWPLRVEPDSRMYQQPEKSGIVLSPQDFELPEVLGGLRPFLAPLMIQWRSGVSLEEIQLRVMLLQ